MRPGFRSSAQRTLSHDGSATLDGTPEFSGDSGLKQNSRQSRAAHSIGAPLSDCAGERLCRTLPSPRLINLRPRPQSDPSRPWFPRPPAPGLSAALTLQIGVVIVAALYFAKEVLIPLTLAILLSFVLAPLVDLLRRLRLGRTPSVLVAVILALALILALGGVIGSQVAQVANEHSQLRRHR